MDKLSVLIAPDKFKGSLSAREVAEAIRSGIEASGRPDIRSTVLPLADGGDGTVEAAHAAGYDRYPLVVVGPTGDLLSTAIAFDGHTAVIEVATICGLRVLPEDWCDPLGATSHGVGEAIAHAAQTLGARTIVVGLGGSATTDGGAGMLHALGARFFAASGKAVEPVAGELHSLSRVDLSGLLPLSGIELVGASDVRNVLLGTGGAAAVFAPQKGADPAQVAVLERGLERLRDLTDDTGLSLQAGAGSAGGLGYAVLRLGGALTSGAAYILDLLDFDQYVADADVVITGEGSLDAQTEAGKLVSVVVQRSGRVPVIAVAGRIAGAEVTARMKLTRAIAISERTDADTSADAALSASILREMGRELAEALPSAANPLARWREVELPTREGPSGDRPPAS